MTLKLPCAGHATLRVTLKEINEFYDVGRETDTNSSREILFRVTRTPLKCCAIPVAGVPFRMTRGGIGDLFRRTSLSHAC